MRFYMLAVLVAFVAMNTAPFAGASAQEVASDQQKAMEEYAKLMATNENHVYMRNFTGEWNVTTTSWMQPGAPPSKNSGTSKGELVLGGRYLMMKYEGLMFGRPFEGIQIIGYDNQQRKYVSFWIDNMGTAFYFTTGTREAGANTIDETGVWPDPMGGSSKVRSVTRLMSPDEFTYELYMVGSDGGEFKSLENRVTRKK